jgi:hypothetical protein
MAGVAAIHEPIQSRRKVVAASNRSFGIVFGCFFALVGLWPLFSQNSPRLWALGLAVFFLLVGLFAPQLLAPLNRSWFLLGSALHNVTNPIIMFFIYYGAVVPVGLILRARGNDPLRLKWDPRAESYWIAREPPGPPPGSMSKQF